MSDLFSDLTSPPSAGPYHRPRGVTLPSVPIAADGDPVSSHAAGDRHTASGARGRNCQAVLALVREHPGLTAKELHAAQGPDGDLERHEISRRLSDLWHAGEVDKGPMRDCTVGRGMALTWVVRG